MESKRESAGIPLFRQYPSLQQGLPYISLGQFPTPVERLSRLGEETGVTDLYIKRDDLSGELYGGNKVRKLEFTLARALQVSAKEVLTYGFAGSNHALATAIYARHLGLKSISMLMQQPNAHYVRRNLLMSCYCGAELHQHRNVPVLALGTMYQLLRHRLISGAFPVVIPGGGSSPLGIIGFVNAAFELKEQIIRGLIPEPDYIYLALGSTGTAAGLMVGLMAAGVKSHVVCVRVAPTKFANARRTVGLCIKTGLYLRSLDPTFPEYKIGETGIDIRHDFYGKGYAHFTAEGMEAVRRIRDNEAMELEGTYTGKTLACLISDAGSGDLKDKAVLFWNTHNSRDFSHSIADMDYRKLPGCFHRYFQEDVQPLDG